jgi:hypothetical protein
MVDGVQWAMIMIQRGYRGDTEGIQRERYELG